MHDKLDKCFAGEKQSVANLTVLIAQDFDIQFIWSIVSNMEEEEDDHAQ